MRTLPNHGVDAHILTKPLHSLRTAVRGVSGGQRTKLERECQVPGASTISSPPVAIAMRVR